MRLRTVLLAVTVLGFGLSSGAMAQRDDSMTIRTSELKIDAANPVIDLNVSESVTSAPDMASFGTGVETSAPKARDAIQKNAVKMSAVMAQLKAMGIAEKDIQTSALSLRRDVDYLPTGKTRFKGYTVSNQITAKLRDLSRLGDVLDTLAVSGATEFNGPVFELDNNDTAKNAARDKAWATATKLAEYHARKAGFSGVKVVRVSEAVSQQSQQEPVYALKAAYAAEAAADAVSTPMAAGEISTEVRLSVSFNMVR
jgi:uncharacterized protein